MPIPATDFALIDGELQTLAEAKVSVLDLGFLRGVGVFETLRTYLGHPHALGQHLRRLGDSAAALGISSPYEDADIRKAIDQARSAGGAEDFRINLILTPGIHTSGVFGAEKPTGVVLLRALQKPPRWWYEQGVHAITFTGERIHPEFKTTAYLTGRKGLMQAEEAQAQEALYTDPEGFVAEGVTSNVVVVRRGRLISPALPNLPGITRAGLWQLAQEAGVDCQTEAVHRDDLYRADEVWICSAIRELVPVVRIDDQSIGDGTPGPLARRLGPAYHERCIADARADAEATRG